MDVCEDCLSRLARTEVQSLHERWVPPDDWDVSTSGLLHAAATGCAICDIHCTSLVESGQIAAVSKGFDPLETDTEEGEVNISHQWLAKGETAEDLSDLTRLMISGHAYDIFAHPGETATSFELCICPLPSLIRIG